MNIKLEKLNLLEGVNKANKAITGKSINNLLDSLYLNATEEGLQLIGSDGNITVITTVENCTIVEEGKILVDSKLFSEIIRKLPDSEIELKVVENALEIKCGTTLFKLGTANAEDYPQIVIPNEDGDSITLQGDTIKELVKSVSFAASADETRPILKGILFEIKEQQLNLVALDGYRLAKATIPTETGDLNISCVINSKDFIEASRMFNNSEMEIKITNNHGVFKDNKTLILSRLLEGRYVDYKNLIPQDFSLKVNVDRGALVNSLERVALMSSVGGNKLSKLSINDNELTITARSTVGQAREDLQIEKNSDINLDIAFNVKYILDSLKAIDDERVMLNLGGAVNPCVIKGVQDEVSTHLVLPVRLRA